LSNPHGLQSERSLRDREISSPYVEQATENIELFLRRRAFPTENPEGFFCRTL